MKLTLFLTAALFGLVECSKDETVSAFVPDGKTWYAISMKGRPTTTEIYVEFPEEGVIRGKGPCNTFSATQTEPYPWFKAENIVATKAACRGIQEEQIFFIRLGMVTEIEVAGTVMIMTDKDGDEIVFESR